MFLYLVPYPYWETTATLWQIFRFRYSEKIVTSFCSSCCTCCALMLDMSTRVNTNQHESNTSQHESDTSQQSPTQVSTNQHESNTSPTRVNTNLHDYDTSQHDWIRINTNQSKSNAGLDHEKEKSMTKRKNKM